MQLRVGQDIVYPKYGLGKILEIRRRKLPTGKVKRGVLIRFPALHMTVWVPEERLGETKIRKPISRAVAKKVMQALKSRARFRVSTKGKERVGYYKEKVLSGDPIDLAETVRDLVRLSIRKALNVREAELANRALRTLVREIALATNKDVEDVKQEIEAILYR